MISIQNQADIVRWLAETDAAKIKELYDAAYELKLSKVGNKVYFRGIIEFSNACIKNCNYCGIRRDNKGVHRYFMSKDEILELAQWAFENRYGSVVLQSGERTDSDFIAFIDEVIADIVRLSGGKLGITLCLGEQTRETYKRWFDLGAHRYLLRIEASNPELYAKIHPADHSFEARRDCLSVLKEIGYQTGTGVMIGLPGQTFEDLAGDIEFFKRMDIDMIGMGPYIPHQETPLAREVGDEAALNRRNLDLGLKMIALTRLYLGDVNIAATTALQALHPTGREMGLKAGANIIMPIITHKKYRADYVLYDNKPCIDDNADDCKSCLEGRIRLAGETIGYGEWGDSPHYAKP